MKEIEENIEFIVALTEHRALGHILVPFLIHPNESGNFYTVKSQVVKQDVTRNPADFTEAQIKVIDIIDKYTDESLARRFSRTQGSKEFFHNLDEEFFKKHVFPFIDKQIVTCLDVIAKGGIKLYFKPAKYNNVYDEDQISIPKDIAVPTFRFDLNNEGLKYSLNIEYKNEPLKIRYKKPIIVTDSPCRMVLNNELISFERLSSKKLTPFLQKDFVKIPLSVAEKYMKTFVFGIVRDHKVISRGFNVVDVESEKKAILSIEPGLELEPLLLLKYQYGNKRFSAGQSGTVEVEFKKIGDRFVFYKHIRDAEWEQNLESFLNEKGLELSSNQLVFNEKGNPFNDSYKYAAVNWLNTYKEDLDRKDIRLEQNLGGNNFYTGNQVLDVSVKMEDDWFDLHAIVKFGAFEIPFLRLKRNILSGKREFILPNGEVAILPIEWFVKYREILPFSDNQGDNLRFSKHHFSLLENTVDDLDEKILEEIKKLDSTEFVLLDEPEGLNAELRTYQQEGFSWMKSISANGFGGCLADDMGLGKTLQTLTMLLKNKEENAGVKNIESTQGVNEPQLFENKNSQPASLIILPTSLVHNWQNEIKKFTPSLKYYRHQGTSRKKIANLKGVLNYYDVILTTYGTIRNDFSFLSEVTFNYIILDESQYIKNPDSKTYKAVCELKSKNKLVLTGTPIENSLSDLWAQINFLNRGLLGSISFFKREFIQPIEKKNDEEKQKQLFKIITPFILRRTKEKVAKDLPPKVEQIRYCKMTDDQGKVYEEQKSLIRNSLLENIENIGTEKSTFLALQGLTKLRQLANHPKMVDYPDATSGKFDEVLRSMSNLMAEDHKVLIFSSFVTHLNLFKEEFEKRGWEHCILTGRTRDRESVIKDFQQNKNKRIFLISLKAGGVGLNLTSADYIFILDPWWNPAAENQAVNRAHRIGQDKNVFVYRFITEDSIEEKIQLLKERKSVLAEKFIQSNNPFKSFSSEDLMGLFK